MTWTKNIFKKPKGLLFHYTTIDGLIGIFRDKKIWATSVSHLNDKKELAIAADMFRDTIAELEPGLELPPEPAIPPLGYEPDPRRKLLDALRRFPDIAQESKTFACSFSEEGDQLSQWRGYTTGGYGFSIGFDYSRLKKHVDRQKVLLAKCIYNPPMQRECILGFVKEEIEPQFRDLTNDNITRRMVECLVLLFHVLPVLKHASFKEEKEWRLISSLHSNGQMKLRAGRMTLIPYHEFELTDPNNKKEPLPIGMIYVGPSPNSAESVIAINALLDQEGLSKAVEVRPSAIPYREI
jgi:hypothetical protein